MDNPEKLATQGTGDEDKQSKKTTQTTLTRHKPSNKQHMSDTQTMLTRHKPSNKQLELKTN